MEGQIRHSTAIHPFDGAIRPSDGAIRPFGQANRPIKGGTDT